MDDIKVVGVGLATLDVLLRLGDMPTWQQNTRVSGFALDGGGPVATALVAVARLGITAGYVGTAGTDRTADLKIQSLVENGVDVSRVVYRPGPEPHVVVVYVQEETGERLFAGFNGGDRAPLLATEMDRDYITAADYLHLDGLQHEAALQAADWMHAAGKTVVLDGSKTNRPVSEAMQRLVEKVDVLICAEGFGPGMTGLTDVWDVGRAILDMGPRIVVQTAGEQGSYTVTRDTHFHTPAFDVDVLDTTGAGDVFHGAFIVGLTHSWDLQAVAAFSTAVAALKCTQLGGRAGIPTFAQTLEFLHAQGIELD